MMKFIKKLFIKEHSLAINSCIKCGICPELIGRADLELAKMLFHISPNCSHHENCHVEQFERLDAAVHYWNRKNRRD